MVVAEVVPFIPDVAASIAAVLLRRVGFKESHWFYLFECLLMRSSRESGIAFLTNRPCRPP